MLYKRYGLCAFKSWFLTGKYQQRCFEANGTGFGDSGDIGLSNDVVTMADVFQKNNYKTIAIGKWHLEPPSDHQIKEDLMNFMGFSRWKILFSYR
jgi:arylsulfatase A-like enzyme